MIKVHDVEWVLHTAICAWFRLRLTNNVTMSLISERISVEVQTLIPSVMTTGEILAAISAIRVTYACCAVSEVKIVHRPDHLAFGAWFVLYIRLTHGFVLYYTVYA